MRDEGDKARDDEIEAWAAHSKAMDAEALAVVGWFVFMLVLPFVGWLLSFFW